jgi:hypothetical protein
VGVTKVKLPEVPKNDSHKNDDIKKYTEEDLKIVNSGTISDLKTLAHNNSIRYRCDEKKADLQRKIREGLGMPEVEEPVEKVRTPKAPILYTNPQHPEHGSCYIKRTTSLLNGFVALVKQRGQTNLGTEQNPYVIQVESPKDKSLRRTNELCRGETQKPKSEHEEGEWERLNNWLKDRFEQLQTHQTQ